MWLPSHPAGPHFESEDHPHSYFFNDAIFPLSLEVTTSRHDEAAAAAGWPVLVVVAEPGLSPELQFEGLMAQDEMKKVLKHFRIIYFTLPNCFCDAPDATGAAPSVAAVASAVLDALTELQSSPDLVLLAGGASAATVCCHLATSVPAAVVAAALLSPGHSWGRKWAYDFSEELAPLNEDERKPLWEKAIERWESYLALPETLSSACVACARRMPPLATARGWAVAYPIHGNVPPLHCPTLILQGDAVPGSETTDPLMFFSAEAAANVNESINTTGEVLPVHDMLAFTVLHDAGIAPHLSSPAVAAPVVARWLGQVLHDRGVAPGQPIAGEK